MLSSILVAIAKEGNEYHGIIVPACHAEITYAVLFIFGLLGPLATSALWYRTKVSRSGRQDRSSPPKH